MTDIYAFFRREGATAPMQGIPFPTPSLALISSEERNFLKL